MKIAIIGRKKDTVNYEAFFSKMPAHAVTTLFLGDLAACDAVVLPGGGDITPAFFGERSSGSKNIDTELDILQFQALDFCLLHQIPVMGICKGMQIINVAFGGTILQDLPTADIHRYNGADQHHETVIAPGSFLHDLYGEKMIVNSAHHQGLKLVGRELVPIQWCPSDRCIEAIVHESLPVFGLQWHPERLQQAGAAKKTAATDDPLLDFFASLIWTS